MPIFIADHTGTIQTQSKNLRPIHIGAALIEDAKLGKEPDNIAQNSISSKAVFADLRVHHHIRNVYENNTNFVAIMQYRRMYVLGTPKPEHKDLNELYAIAQSQSEGVIPVGECYRDPLLRYLAQQDDNCLQRELGSDDFIANRLNFGQRSVETQYLDAIKILYPNQLEYIDSWYDMRRILEQKVSKDVVRKCLDGNEGYFNNCFISSWKKFVSYYDFLFDVLDKLKQYENVYRLFGYLGERIFHVFLERTSAKVESRPLIFYN